MKSTPVSLALMVALLFALLTSHPSAQASDFPIDQIPEGQRAFIFLNYKPFFSVSNFSSPPGNFKDQNLLLHVFPVCRDDQDADCISSLDLIDASGKATAGKLKGYLPVSYKGMYFGCSLDGCDQSKEPMFFPFSDRISIKGDPSRGIPDGSRSSIWTFPGHSHGGGSDYLVNFIVNASLSNRENPNAKDSKPDWDDGGNLQGTILPIKIDNDTSGLPTKSEIFEKAADGSIKITGFRDNLAAGGAISNENKTCFAGKSGDLPTCYSRVFDTSSPRFRISLRLDLTKDFLRLRNWFVAQALDIKVGTRIDGGRTVITFEGTSTRQNQAVGFFPNTTEGFQLERAAMNRAFTYMQTNNRPYDLKDLSGFDFWFSNRRTNWQARDEGSVVMWEELEKVAKFRPLPPTASVWNVEAAGISQRKGSWLWPCVKTPQISGAVSSNAAAMEPSPPEWNAATQTLEYRLASSHLDENGKVAEGFYNLTVSEEVARCLWGADLSKARAEVTVVNQEGESKVFTTSYTIRSGYLNFQIYGFTYSVNTVKLRLTGATGNTSSSTQPQVNPSATKKITCVKGKMIKKVSTKTCPKGFKKR